MQNTTSTNAVQVIIFRTLLHFARCAASSSNSKSEDMYAYIITDMTKLRILNNTENKIIVSELLRSRGRFVDSRSKLWIEKDSVKKRQSLQFKR